ncbi:F420-non-reducing hydrogenase iron-sulfur subunit A [Candidatus Zixiibacteriota bacterium]|nr:F420-non-reducing hydrogenase iron-sulfur subunit A [candidate division Zixibacteria bacterium]
MKQILIDPITRLEGHGKIHLFVNDDGSLANAYFQVPELRGFERFCVGRPVEEMCRITTRICGVCPDAHHMAAAKAADAVYGVTIPSAARKLRELMYNAFYAGDHTTHFYALGGPDFVCGPDAPPAERNILGVIAKVGLDAGKKVIAQRARGQRIIEIIGGKKVHPVTSLPGGLSKRITREEQQEMIAIGKEMVEFAKFTIKVLNDVVLSNDAYVDLILSDTFAHKTYNMGLVDAGNKVTFYDGTVRVTAPDGTEHAKYAPKDYLNYVAEHVEPYSYLKYPFLKKVGWKGFVDGMESGVYKASPLSRLNVSDGMATPLAQAEYERFYETLTGDKSGKTPVHATLATHWARVVELVFACEATLLQAQDEEIISDHVFEPPTGIVGEGVGIVEAPRGTLTHHYKTDKNGIITEANLIVGTTNNNAPISMSIKKAAEGLIKKGHEITDGTLNRIEMAFRAYDPCFGCATHSLPGQMPMEILIHDACSGEIIQSRRRNL